MPKRAIFCLFCLLFASTAAWADDPPAPSSGTVDPVCPDAKLWSSRLITKICWSCLFPLRIAGAVTGSADGMPKAASGGGYQPANQIACSCTDNLGVPHPGFALGLWEPARLIEIVRRPGCSPSLGGTKIDLGRLRMLGHPGQGDYGASDLGYYNYHYYSFPLLIILDLLYKNRCRSDGLMDFDLLYLSELDPTWNNDELAFLTAPEAAVFANPVALAACLADGASATAGAPLNPLFWCAGTWGFIYPMSGNARTNGSAPQNSSLLATRALAALHRRGLAWRTMGDDVMCRAKIHPFLVKSQYKFSMFYPYPEANGAHWIGESPYAWGIWRTMPGPGEDHVYLIWRWHDCCHITM